MYCRTIDNGAPPIDPSTLNRWMKAGIVKPALRTAGGQARWDLDDLRRQVEEHLNRES